LLLAAVAGPIFYHFYCNRLHYFDHLRRAIPLLDDEFLTRYTPRFIKKMLWLDNLKLYDLKAEDEEEKKTSFWSHFLWVI
jgi:hypothetical protein